MWQSALGLDNVGMEKVGVYRSANYWILSDYLGYDNGLENVGLDSV